MDKFQRYERLDASKESMAIYTAEVSKTTETMNNKPENPDKATATSHQTKGREEGSHKDRKPKRTGFTSRMREKLVEMEKGVFNFLGGLEMRNINPPGGAHQNSVHPGGPATYAPEGQYYSRGGGGLPNFLASLEQQIINAASNAGGNYYNSVRPGGSAGYAPHGQNSSGSEGGNYNNSVRPGGSAGYAPHGQNSSGSEGGNYNNSVRPGGSAGYAPHGQNSSGSEGGNYNNSVRPGGSAGYAPHGQNSSGSEADFIIQLEGEPHRFTYSELSVATRGFCEESKLGHGGFGSVYGGVLPSGPVAVKKMNHSTTQSQGMKEFKGEVSIIGRLRHRNLIELIGWCEDSVRKEYMLVYELMPNGSLDDVLFKPVEGKTPLSWPQRFKILTGTADALAYIHQGWKKQVIHRDIKCSNIMLDEEWNAKLGDFGIARLLDHEGEADTTNMAGTLGYIAPEVFMDARFTEKTDVFAFGVVILEVACGRRVLPRHSHEMGLIGWVRQALRKDDLLSTVAKNLKDYDARQMKAVLMIGLACCHSNPEKRPFMRHVLQVLSGEAEDELMKMVVHAEEELPIILE